MLAEKVPQQQVLEQEVMDLLPLLLVEVMRPFTRLANIESCKNDGTQRKS
jgi:hypothetical protein